MKELSTTGRCLYQILTWKTSAGWYTRSRVTESRLSECVNETPANPTESICNDELLALIRMEPADESAFIVRTMEALKLFG
jgi:hypothetical protein